MKPEQMREMREKIEDVRYKLCEISVTLLAEMDKLQMSPADYFMPTLAANVDNEKLSDADFREFVRNSIKGLV